MQLEATAHFRVQTMIDREAAAGTPPEPASQHFIAKVHREFYRYAPDAMLEIQGKA